MAHFTRAMLKAGEKDERRTRQRPVDKTDALDTSVQPDPVGLVQSQGSMLRTMRQDAVLRLQQTHGNQYVQRMLHGLSAQRSQVQAGESLEGDDDPNVIMAGELQRQPGDGADPGIVALDAPAATASLSVTTKKVPEDLGCGGYEGKRQWSIANGGASTNGFVVQKINFGPSQQKCDGSDDTDAVTPTYWEAWQVRGGKVFIGTSASAHVADTFSYPSKANHKGKNSIKGAAKYIDGYAAPNDWGHGAPEAGALPSTKDQPAGWSDSGTIASSITETFNCCDGKDEKKLESTGF